VKDATVPDKAIGLVRVRESGCQLMNYATEDLNTGWPQKWYIFQHHTHSRLCAIQMYALTHSLTNCNANEPSQCFGQLKFFHRSPLNSVYTFQKIRLFFDSAFFTAHTRQGRRTRSKPSNAHLNTTFGCARGYTPDAPTQPDPKYFDKSASMTTILDL